MSSVFKFVAEKRDFSGRAATKAVRREGKLPAIVYGGKAAPQSIVLDSIEVGKHLAHEAVYSHVLELKINGKTQKVILKGVQRHPAKAQILHLDFLRVDAKQTLKARVPLHFINESECAGVKLGGVVTHTMVDVEVSCLASALPEYIEVDLVNLELGDAIHLTDIVMPKGVEIVALSQEGDYNYTVAQVMKVRGPVEEVEGTDEEEDAETTEEQPK